MSIKVLIVDNYDSFTYNLAHYLEALGADITVLYNDQIDLGSLSQFDKIVLSPGPGLPKESNQLMGVIKEVYKQKPVLGICLGHQAIAEFFGGTLKNLDKVQHGVSSKIEVVQDDAIFKDIPVSFQVGRYHSWAVTSPLPKTLTLLAISSDQCIMAFKHKSLNLYGIQFHPESILSDFGKAIIRNWLVL